MTQIDGTAERLDGPGTAWTLRFPRPTAGA
jgi:hypothetical protein